MLAPPLGFIALDLIVIYARSDSQPSHGGFGCFMTLIVKRVNFDWSRNATIEILLAA
jgi:hypothetical protein